MFVKKISKKSKIALSLLVIAIITGTALLTSSETLMGRLRKGLVRTTSQHKVTRLVPFVFFDLNFNFGKTPPFSIPTIQDRIEKEEVEITSRTWATEWEEATATYDAYYIPGESFRVVCEQPCEIPENILRKKTEGAYKAIKKLLNLTKADVLQSEKYDLKPVDIHLTSSTECGEYTPKMNAFAGSRYSYLGGSYICTWEWAKENSILSLHGEDAEKNATRLESQALITHEYTHILFYVRSNMSPESFTHTLQKYVAGTWDGSGYEDKDFPKITSACDPSLNKGQTKPMYNLCKKCGFNLEDIGTLLRGIDEIYKNGEGKSDAGKVSPDQFNKILSEITGTECKYGE
jgi:hypothetical protein